MLQLASVRRCLKVAAAALASVAVIGCQGGDDVAGPANPELVLVEAGVTVSGQSIAGQTIRVGQHDGTVRFEARLVDGRDHAAGGHVVRVDYDFPAMGMMRRTGAFMLHDDGTHGDLMAHDGIYCYEDTSSEYGCHGESEWLGEYHYDFCGIREGGHESNRIRITTVLAQ